MSKRSQRSGTLLVAMLIGAATSAAGCFKGERTTAGTATRNAGTLSLVTAREHAGGKNEGPLGFSAPISRSHLYEELKAKGIDPQKLGPLNELAKKDKDTLIAVMKTFAQSLGVECTWCHVKEDFGAPTARKAAAAFMWESFVTQLELTDGSPLYCDSCHHQSTVFLHRNPSEKLALAKYMQLEYVDQLKRKDGQEHGCGTCHSKPFNPRFIPRKDDPEGWTPPAAHPGPQP